LISWRAGSFRALYLRHVRHPSEDSRAGGRNGARISVEISAGSDVFCGSYAVASHMNVLLECLSLRAACPLAFARNLSLTLNFHRIEWQARTQKNKATNYHLGYVSQTFESGRLLS
jgi:hypothetical protein